MAEFSWHTDEKPHISTYLNGAPKKRYLVVDGIAVVGRAVMHYKPNRKGGHCHNHIRNARKRMRKCHICGEPIVNGCEYTDGISEFQCRSCRTEEWREVACLVGLPFGGCSFKIKRKRK
ncbi:hypothetical protein SAMN05720762_10489 [Fibrobacter sp. UWH4]|nr:hypothetical protein SAMN05720762_10489 [Fibrobacter sp. UWH4]